MSRARDRNVAIAIITLVALACAGVIAVILSEKSDDQAADPVSSPTSGGVAAAAVYLSEEEACDAFPEPGVKRQRNREAAAADSDDLADEYLSGDDGPARLVVVGRCDRSFVVSVGVDSITAVVPATGPRGTPVLAYFQPLIVAN